MHQMTRYRLRSAAILLAAGILAACAGNYGQFKRDPALDQAFREGRPPEGFRYYANGRENIPDAVIGIDPAYTLMSKFWRELDFESGQVAETTGRLFPYQLYKPTAYTILAPDGSTIGISYSSSNWPTVKIGEDNQIWVYPAREPASGRAGGGVAFFGSSGVGVGIGF